MRRIVTALLLCAGAAGLVTVAANLGAAQWAGQADARSQQREVIPLSRGFEVDVLVGGVPRYLYPARGRFYVEALEGAEYSLRIRNPLPVRVAVALSVDGLNTIDARRTTARDASKWVIEPYGTITVSGWQVSAARARRFYFTGERDSYAAKLGRPEDTGVISAVFFRERPRAAEVTPPLRRTRPVPLEGPRAQAEGKEKSGADTMSRRAENLAQASRGVAPAPDDEYAATGIGRSVDYSVRWVDLELETRPAAEVTIRYEFRPALVRLGILPRPYPQPDPLRRRERARGFEDGRFCPEP